MRVHHLAFRTFQLERLVAFYTHLFGLSVERRPRPGSAWLALDGATLMLEAASPGETIAAPGALDFVAFAVTPGERDALAARAREAGIQLEASTAFTLYFRDPDGRRVGVSSYPDE